MSGRAMVRGSTMVLWDPEIAQHTMQTEIEC